RKLGWSLIADEWPGGSNHELYPLNILDPSVARDGSPGPRRHSLGELIPDIVALRERNLILGEAKVAYSPTDRDKLNYILKERYRDMLFALNSFAEQHDAKALLPIHTLVIHPVLIFVDGDFAPPPSGLFSYL